mgnify:CR=1 FL=1
MNKKLFLVLAIILFIVGANYFIDPVEMEESLPEESEEMKKLQKEYNQLSLDYINLKAEKEELQNQMESIHADYFDRYIYAFGYQDESLGESSEPLHEEFGEDKYVSLIEDDFGFQLFVWVRGQEYPFYIDFSTLNQENEFDVGPFVSGEDVAVLGGIATNDQFEDVFVLQDDMKHGADVIQIEDDLFVWYSILDFEEDGSTDRLAGVRVEVHDSNGKVLWEKALNDPS